MIRYKNRDIPETIEELVNPAHTVLLVVDVQNDFCSPGGGEDLRLHQTGRDIGILYRPMLDALKRLIEAARLAGTLVVYLFTNSFEDHRTDSAAHIWHLMRAHQVRHPKDIKRFVLAGTWGAEIVESVAPGPRDIVICKFRNGGFVHTQLEHVLRSNDIKTVIATGVVTEGCVESTVRGALERDFFVVMAKDCVGSYRDELAKGALLILERRCDIIASKEIVEAWEAIRHPRKLSAQSLR